MRTLAPPPRGNKDENGSQRSPIYKYFAQLGKRRVAALTAALLVLGGLAYLVTLPGLPDPTLPTLKEVKQGVKLYDRKGNWIATAHAERDRLPVPLSRISVHARNAIIAAEDRHFFKHEGIDPSGIMRAFIANYNAGRIVEGGSTITQQLVRNLYLDRNDVSIDRKLREVLLSINVDSRYSKAKILETYMNEIYFGGGAYGIERAAMRFFNKHAAELNIAESAYLAGLIRSPSVLSAPKNHGAAIERQKYVIGKMAEFGFISPDEARTAYGTRLSFIRGPHVLRFPHYLSTVLEELEVELGEDLWTKDWRVFTHLDVKAQELAERTISFGIKNAPSGIDQGALVSLSLSDGGVLSMVGGVGRYEVNEWNRATNPHTAGSSFKPFVYLSALEAGKIDPESRVADAPLVIQTKGAPPWAPKNFDGQFRGMMTVRQALATSRNVCAVRVAQLVGFKRVAEVARKAGIKSANLAPYPAIAIGYCAVSPFEMAMAYSTIARGGVYIEPRFVRKIEDGDGNLVKNFEVKPERRFSRQATAQLVDILQDVVKKGTGTRARLPGLSVAGKTGTADGNTDIWFIGFTPDTLTAVWGGNDLHRRVKGRHVTGGVVMAKMWNDYMSAYYKFNKPPTRLAFDKPMESVAVSPSQWQEATREAPSLEDEVTRKANELSIEYFSSENSNRSPARADAQIEIERPEVSRPEKQLKHRAAGEKPSEIALPPGMDENVSARRETNEARKPEESEMAQRKMADRNMADRNTVERDMSSAAVIDHSLDEGGESAAESDEGARLPSYLLTGPSASRRELNPYRLHLTPPRPQSPSNYQPRLVEPRSRVSGDGRSLFDSYHLSPSRSYFHPRKKYLAPRVTGGSNIIRMP